MCVAQKNVTPSQNRFLTIGFKLCMFSPLFSNKGGLSGLQIHALLKKLRNPVKPDSKFFLRQSRLQALRGGMMPMRPAIAHRLTASPRRENLPGCPISPWRRHDAPFSEAEEAALVQHMRRGKTQGAE
jgi:hypothetical protein